MKSWMRRLIVAFVAMAGIGSGTPQAADSEEPAVHVLKTGWRIRASADTPARGEQISTPGFDCRAWYAATVPSTVLATLVKNGVYRDPYFAKNLDGISSEPFRGSWWYRTEFDLPAAARHDCIRLVFDGINFRANVFLNGQPVATADELYGAFCRFDRDVSRRVRAGANALAVEVFPPKPGDFTIGYIDWNPTPPDRNMGLWREVKLRCSGPVSADDVFVRSKVDVTSLQAADLTISTTLVNRSDRAVSGTVEGRIEERRVVQPYSLGPSETKEILFAADRYPQLHIEKPRLWWPNNLGDPNLYRLTLTVNDKTGVSDSHDVGFGIREIGDYVNEEGHRGYTVNGRKVLIRGAGWVDDMLLDQDDRKLEAQMRYARHMNLNTIRLEGFWGSNEMLYDLADRYGLLLMAGWSCQWEWKDYLGKECDEYGGVRTAEDIDLVARYLRDQVVWLRNHPSLFVWVLGSDALPRPEFEKRYRSELARVDPTRPVLAACTSLVSSVSGPTGVKMNGPYDYVTPNYWYLDRENGGAFGFNTETGPGPQPPPAESIARMFSADHYWPIDDVWDFHAGRREFGTMKRYLKAFDRRYGAAESMEEFAAKAQAANYEAIRPMFEAFAVRRPSTTGVVQWMLNAAWPKMFWQLYDYYLMPGGAFYGTRKACQPLAIVYDYGDRDIHVVNDTGSHLRGLRADARVISMDSKELFAKSVDMAVDAGESKRALEIPEMGEAHAVYFVDLKLKDVGGRLLADNFYWLSAREDVLDPEGTEWFYTPNREYADFTPLKELKEAQVQVAHQFAEEGGEGMMKVTLSNSGPQIAFFMELKVVGDKTGHSVLPVFWDDNYVSLLPGETRSLHARFAREDLRGERPVLRYSGWNVKED